MANFKLSSHIDSNKVFLVDRVELSGRLDPFYYQPEIAELEKRIKKISKRKLRDYIIRISSGATPSVKEEDKYYSDKENGIPFLRVQNLQTNSELSLDDVKYINNETHEGLLKRSQVEENDLLVKITGVGRMAIASVAPKDFEGNTNQHMVVIKTANEDISRYLANFLNLDITEKLASRRATGGTRPALDYPALKSIPIVEGINFKILENAEQQKKELDAKAKRLLDSIDDYLLDELGIKIPIYKNVLKNRIYSIKISSITNKRFDPEYYKLEYYRYVEAITSSKYSISNLKEITSVLDSGKTPGSKEYAEFETNYPIIKVGSYTNDYIDIKKLSYTNTEYKLKAYKGDIFILSAAHQAEYVGRHIKFLEKQPPLNTSYVGELICIRVNNRCNPIFLFSLLNTELYKILINREKTGQTSHIYGKDLKKILIPLPSITKQGEIAKYIENIRRESKRLQEEGEFILKKAKNEIEQKLFKL